MSGKPVLGGLALLSALTLALCAPELSLSASEASVTRTNWAERWITNVIEVTMPTNRFVNEYHTNWVPQVRTTTIDVYATNWSMRTVTNHIMVEALWTNTVVAYKTNVITRTLTNSVAVNLLQTNVLDRYHTNWSTLNLTNWVTVIMFKTNWLTQPVTNVAQVDMSSRPATALPAPSEVVSLKEPVVEAAPPAPAGGPSAPLVILATRTTRPPANNLVEVQMKVRWAGNGSAQLRVQSWRIQREDGAVFMFGQEQEFLRQLPVGKYTVEARLKAEEDGPLYVARGTLSVTLHDAVIHQRLLAKK
jgi:hypothetical protein